MCYRIRIHIRNADPDPDPDPGRPKLSPKKVKNEEISCLKSSLLGRSLSVLCMGLRGHIQYVVF
jgi:hypothetical protein